MITVEHPCKLHKHSVVATIGMFDGIHLGHQQVISMVREVAQMSGKKSAVITFAEHPQKVLYPNSDIRMIMSLQDRLTHMEQLNLDYAIILRFDKELANLNAKQFIQLIHDCYNVTTLIIGFNHRFGHNREETFDDYVQHGKSIGVQIIKAKEYLGKHCPVSSSIIRRLISSGKVSDAANCLSRPFEIKGTVVHGFKNGRKIGFPTANIQPTDQSIIIPHNGVYAATVRLQDTAELYYGMVNIGIRPTFNNAPTKSIEVNIFDFDKEIYDQQITVEFKQFVRSEQKMDSIESLKSQLAIDEQNIRKILNSDTIK